MTEPLKFAFEAWLEAMAGNIVFFQSLFSFELNCLVACISLLWISKEVPSDSSRFTDNWNFKILLRLNRLNRFDDDSWTTQSLTRKSISMWQAHDAAVQHHELMPLPSRGQPTCRCNLWLIAAVAAAAVKGQRLQSPSRRNVESQLRSPKRTNLLNSFSGP